MDYERFFLDQLPLIDRVVRGVGRRYRLLPEEVEDLRGAIHAKLIDHDYEVLRRFQNRSQIQTYLTAVVVRHVLDDRNARWGKWRPSVEAKRRGPVAVLLERLIRRDGLPFDQAAQILRTNHHVDASLAELEAISRALPSRTPRHFVGDDALELVASPADAAAGVEERERAALAARVHAALAAVLSGLLAQDQLIVKMLFRDAMQVAHVARLLKVEAKPLYRRVEQLRRRLREALEARGVTRDDMRALTGGASTPWDEPLHGDEEGHA